MNREQKYIVTTGRRQRIIVVSIIIALFLVAALLFTITKLHIYTPPSVAKSQIAGEPELDESLLYEHVNSEFGYSFSISANLYQREDGSLYLYLANDDSNDVYLNCEIVDIDTDKVLYQSDIVEPGYYLEKIEPEHKFDNKMYNIRIKVHAFEKDTWYSAGTTNLDMVLQPW